MNWLDLFWQALNIFSRAGGGGSSSGGGGGSSSGGGSFGGSGGSSGLDVESFVATILMFAGMFIGGLLMVRLQSKLEKRLSSGWIKFIAVLLAVVVSSIGFVMGSLAAVGKDWLWLVAYMMAIGLPGGILVVAFEKAKKSSSSKLASANNLDSALKSRIVQRANQVFQQYQADWQSKNLESIRSYTTPHYFGHAALMLKAIKEIGRHSELSGINIYSAKVINYQASEGSAPASAWVAFNARMNALLVDSTSGKVLQEDKSPFVEYWKFIQSGDTWLLDEIKQDTEDPTKLEVSLQEFAATNDMYFSPDWGHQLIPTRGQLFKSGFVGTDINNHVIGQWGGLIVQLYTYSPNITTSSPTYYVIGQISLPKSYGGILVRRKGGGLFNKLSKPEGYERYELEWGEFNQRYEVLATDADKFTSFELLNPAFMAWLYDQNLKVNIEVVDNVVYLYSKVSVRENRYSEMLEILRRAHAELKM